MTIPCTYNTMVITNVLIVMSSIQYIFQKNSKKLFVIIINFSKSFKILEFNLVNSYSYSKLLLFIFQINYYLERCVCKQSSSLSSSKIQDLNYFLFLSLYLFFLTFTTVKLINSKVLSVFETFVVSFQFCKKLFNKSPLLNIWLVQSCCYIKVLLFNL